MTIVTLTFGIWIRVTVPRARAIVCILIASYGSAAPLLSIFSPTFLIRIIFRVRFFLFLDSACWVFAPLILEYNTADSNAKGLAQTSYEGSNCCCLWCLSKNGDLYFRGGLPLELLHQFDMLGQHIAFLGKSGFIVIILLERRLQYIRHQHRIHKLFETHIASLY